MTRSFLAVIVLMTSLFFSSSAVGDRAISLPHEERFDAKKSLDDLAWATQGGAITWVADQGWNGGGAVKVTAPKIYAGYAGVGSFVGFGEQVRLNVRFLMNFGRSFASKAPTGKQIIMNRTAGRDQGVYRPMLLDNGNLRNGELTRWWYPCLQILCTMHNPVDRFDQPLELSSGKRSNEWISYELEADLKAKRVNLYIHTQDARVKGLYATHDMNAQESFDSTRYPIVMIQGIGFYWGTPDELVPVEQRDDQTYVMIDEIKIDKQYIGPPKGFTGRE